jgi:hypothetical protein
MSAQYLSWDVRGQVTDISYKDVRGAFEAEHPQNMVDASDVYVLTVYPFGRNDEHPDDYESEVWETGIMVGSRFRVHGSRSLGSPWG